MPTRYRNLPYIEHHLQYNHFPPVSLDWVPVCERAVTKAQQLINDSEPFRVPGDARVRRPASHGGGLVSVWDVVEALHLDGYLEEPWWSEPYVDSDFDEVAS